MPTRLLYASAQRTHVCERKHVRALSCVCQACSVAISEVSGSVSRPRRSAHPRVNPHEAPGVSLLCPFRPSGTPLGLRTQVSLIKLRVGCSFENLLLDIKRCTNLDSDHCTVGSGDRCRCIKWYVWCSHLRMFQHRRVVRVGVQRSMRDVLLGACRYFSRCAGPVRACTAPRKDQDDQVKCVMLVGWVMVAVAVGP